MFNLVLTDGTVTKLEISTDTDESILLLTFRGKLVAEDARKLNEMLLEQLERLDKAVTLIIDSEEMKVDPRTDFRSVQRQLTYTSSPALEHIYIISANKLTRLWMLLIHKRAQVKIDFIDDIADVVTV